MKYRNLVTWACIVILGLVACGKDTLPNSQQTEIPSASIASPLEESLPVDPMQRRLVVRCEEVAAAYRPLY